MSIRIEEFGVLFKFLPKSGLQASEGRDLGRYPFFTSSNIQKKWIDVPFYETEGLVFGTGGNASVHYVNGGFSTSADCIVAEPNELGLACSRYCFHYLNANIGLLAAGFRGAGLKHIAKGYIQSIKIPLPPLVEQLRVASIIDSVETLRSKRKEALMQLEDLTKSIFLETFGNPISNKKKWPLARLDNLAQIERGKFSPRPRNDPRYYGGCFPFIQTGDISNSNGRLTAWSQTLNERGKAVSRSFPPGTVVIAIVGATLGITAILDIEVFCPDSVIGLIADPSKSSPEYIDWILRFWRPIFVAQAPATARANMNLESLRPLLIPVPPVSLQREFSHQVAAIDLLKAAHIASLSELDALFASLQHRAFRGEL